MYSSKTEGLSRNIFQYGDEFLNAILILYDVLGVIINKTYQKKAQPGICVYY